MWPLKIDFACRHAIRRTWTLKEEERAPAREKQVKIAYSQSFYLYQLGFAAIQSHLGATPFFWGCAHEGQNLWFNPSATNRPRRIIKVDTLAQARVKTPRLEGVLQAFQLTGSSSSQICASRYGHLKKMFLYSNDPCDVAPT